MTKVWSNRVAVFRCGRVGFQWRRGGTATAPTIADLVIVRVARLTRLLTLTTAQANQIAGYLTTEETTLATVRTNIAAARLP